MAITKAELITQFDGFGNDNPKSLTEYYRSSGFSRSALGITANRALTSWYSTTSTLFPDVSALSNVNTWAEGYGRDIGSTGTNSSPYLYALDNNGVIVQSLAGTGTPQVVYYTNKNGSHYGSGSGTGGMGVDQKKRLLFVGERYLGRMDTSVSEGSGTFTISNGASSITLSSGSFEAGDAGKLMRATSGGGVWYYVRLNSFTSASQMSIYSSWSAPTGTYVGIILRNWTEQWKDFGASYSMNSEGGNARIPVETYEDTVLFGRGNIITSLNTLTDSITTDAVPAFTLPTGYDVLHIHKGSNGVLIGANAQSKGVLILWDNFSDRSIAPWINLPDRLINVSKYSGGWIVETARELFFTNGYSLTSLKDNYLDSSLATFASNLIPQSSFVSENAYFSLKTFHSSGKRRGGLYKMGIESKLFEFYPRASLDQYNTDIKSIFYGAGNGTGRIYIGTANSLEYLQLDTQPNVAVYVSNPIGKSANLKYARTIELDLGVGRQVFADEIPFSFTVTTKICPLEKQIQSVGQVKTLQTVSTQIVVDETTYASATVGEEIEFLEGNNAGYSRNITAISGGGTNTATYTLDRALPALSASTDVFLKTGFRLVKSQTFTNVTEIPRVSHGVKNRVAGVNYLIKIEIEGATVPIEIRPSNFIYDDTGI